VNISRKSNPILLSFIVPAYNAETFVHSSLKSIVNQKTNNIEIIFIDDGSTDNTYMKATEILSCLSEDKYSVVRTKNNGVASARNTGIDIARGEYIYFLDSDDYIADDFIEQIMPLIKEYSYDVVCWGYDMVNDDKDKAVLYTDCHKLQEMEKSGIGFLKDIIINRSISLSTINTLVRRALIERTGLRFYDGCSCGEDIEFIYKLLLDSESVFMLGKVISFYTIRENSMTNSYNPRRFEFIGAFLRTSAFFKSSNINDALVFADILKNEYLLYHYLIHLRGIVKHSTQFKPRKIMEDVSLFYPDIHGRIKAIIRKGCKYYKSFFVQAIIYAISPVLYIRSYKIYLKLQTISRGVWRNLNVRKK